MLAAAIICAFSSFAAAKDFRLKALPGSETILVWKSKDAHKEAMSLIAAGVHKTKPELVARLLACTAKPGTKVIIKDMGLVTHDIMVVEGRSAGCRGNIPAEELSSR